MSKVKDLQAANLDSPEKIAKSKAADMQAYFPEEKQAKAVIAAAKRVSKKRAAGGEESSSSQKKSRKTENHDSESPEGLEASLALPVSDDSEEDLARTILFSNRAPLYMAFTVTLLKYTMPHQPLSSRLSLAQAYISTSSRDRAVNLGIQALDKSEVEAEERLAEGQPMVTIMTRQIRVLRRWGYEWEEEAASTRTSSTVKEEAADVAIEPPKDRATDNSEDAASDQPAVWALDLEALRKSIRTSAPPIPGTNSNLPIYTPQSARSYMLRAFNSSEKKDSADGKSRNLGKLLKALDLLYASWAKVLEPDDLEKRTWGWYVKVRPEVADGAAGWGGKNRIELGKILALRRETSSRVSSPSPKS